MRALTILIVLLAPLAGPAVGAEPVEQMLSELAAAGAGPFSVDAGRALWRREHRGDDGGSRACTSCHTADVRRPGRHAVTGKPIDPLAPSVELGRLSERREIEKWLRRNCKWTLGRACSAQEIGDILTYLRSQ
jgi:hypothetical protein